MLKIIKKYIPEYIKGTVLSMLQPRQLDEYKGYKGKKKIIVALAGFYQNLGDMALTYAQYNFLKTNFPEYEVILLDSHDTYLKTKALKKICTEEDIITIIGGGNMDDIYVSLENARRFIIKNFPRNKVISFPQTFSFSDTKFGKKRLKKTIRTYSKHRNLTIFAREEKSLNYMTQYFSKNKVFLAPDIVLSLEKREPEFKREGAITCFRNDKEKALGEKEHKIILDIIKQYYDRIEVTDTINVTLEECSRCNYEQTLEKFWRMLKSREIVITDRLHCMIFCVITDTPCIVFPSTNQKIKGTYMKWLKDFKNVYLIEIDNIEALNDILSQSKRSDRNKSAKLLKDSYVPLLRSLKE